MTLARLNLTGDYGLARQGACFEPITAAIGAVSAFASANAGALSALSTISTLAGGAITAVGKIEEGKQAKAAAQSQALQMEQQATQARAAGQRNMFERQRQTELTQSSLQARSAASGGGATDATVLNLGGAIAARGEQQALTDLYNGENNAIGLEDNAKAKRISGNAALTGSYYGAAGTIFSTLGSGFSKYATTKPEATPKPGSDAP